MEQFYTSTGNKLLYWKENLEEYKNSNVTNPILTHISPEGSCNLKCEYCSVAKRESNTRIKLDDIRTYLTKLVDRGLKSVILTGGGEPTLYPQINELFEMIYGFGLECALITNGTRLHNVKIENLNRLKWMRVSINDKPFLNNEIVIPKLDSKVFLGFSYICMDSVTVDHLKNIENFVLSNGGRYVRLLPDCTHDNVELAKKHDRIKELIKSVSPIFFHQNKMHGTPNEAIKKCPMGYFRPYLSEQINSKGQCGLIYPCDSVVLNSSDHKFDNKFSICDIDEVEQFLDGQIVPKFKPSVSCDGCVFIKNLDLIHTYCNGDLHENFI